MSRLKPSPAMLLAFVALLVALSGSSYAAPARDAAAKLITGKQVKKNTLTGAHIKNGSLTAADIRGGIPAGPQGPRGAEGERGPAGAPGARGADAEVLWAVVTTSGDVTNGKGVVSAENDPNNVGEFTVKFNRNVRNCAYAVTESDRFGDYAPGMVQVTNFAWAGQGISADKMGVSTRTAAGAREDRPFHVAVYC